MGARREAGEGGGIARRVAGLLAVAAAALASLATSPPRTARNFPTWEVHGEPTLTVGCARLGAWVSKAGKEGLGLSLTARSEAACTVAVRSATLRLGGGRPPVGPLELPPPLALGPGAEGPLYVAFAFDGEETWNDGDREATLELAVETSSGAGTWSLPLRNVLRGFHRPVRGGEDP